MKFKNVYTGYINEWLKKKKIMFNYQHSYNVCLTVFRLAFRIPDVQ